MLVYVHPKSVPLPTIQSTGGMLVTDTPTRTLRTRTFPQLSIKSSGEIATDGAGVRTGLSAAGSLPQQGYRRLDPTAALIFRGLGALLVFGAYLMNDVLPGGVQGRARIVLVHLRILAGLDGRRLRKTGE